MPGKGKVAESAVVGAKDETTGQAIMAYVIVKGGTETSTELGEREGDRLGSSADGPPQLLVVECRGEPPHELQPGPERRHALAVRPAATPEGEGPSGLGRGGDLLAEPRLPYPGFARDEEQAQATSVGVAQGMRHPLHFLRATA